MENAVSPPVSGSTLQNLQLSAAGHQRSLNALSAERNALNQSIAQLRNSNQAGQNQYKNDLQKLDTVKKQILEHQREIIALNRDISSMEMGMDNISIFQDFMVEMKSILSKYSSVVAGRRIDEAEMVVKTLPENELMHTDIAKATCERQSLGAFNELLSKLGNINAQDGEGRTLLMHALMHGFFPALDLLLARPELDCNITDNKGQTALIYACTMPHLKYVPQILSRTADVNLKTLETGNTAMHLVIAATRDKLFSDEYDDYDLTDGSGNVFFDASQFVGNLVITGGTFTMGSASPTGRTINQAKTMLLINMLCEGGLDFNAQNNQGQTPFMIACAHRLKYLVNTCLDQGDLVDTSKIDNNGYNSLLWVLEVRDTAIVERFLNDGFSADYRDSEGRTSFFWMSIYNQPEMLQLLLRHGADPSICGNSGSTALHAAAETGAAKVMPILLNHFDVNERMDTPHQITPLWMACQNGHLEAVKYLLTHGANPALGRADMDISILRIAINKQHLAVVQELVARDDVDANAPDNGGIYPIHAAAELGSTDIVRLLLNYSDVNVRAIAPHQITALWLACQNGKAETIELLLQSGGDINLARADNGISPISMAMQKNHVYVVKKLLARDDVDLSAVDGANAGVIHYATVLDNLEIMQILVDKQIDINAQNAAGLTALYVATLKNSPEMAALLLAGGAEHDIPNVQGFYPIHGAVHHGHMGMMEILLPFINTQSSGGHTPLYYAIICQAEPNLELIQFLFDHGADSSISHAGGYFPIHGAVHNHHLAALELLLQNGVDINSHDLEKHSATPLYYSMGYGNQEIKLGTVDVLLAHGADTNIPEFDGDTPMHMAGYRARVDLMQRLIAHGASVNAQNDNGETALYVCIKQPDFATDEQKLLAVQYLLANDAEVAPESGLSALDAASQYLVSAMGFLEHPESVRPLEEFNIEVLGGDEV
ncbi:MAG: hypothetical protein COA94_08345 [Rickettsiales bacterium]|nr:MAG: hypothetical protein COA94_08345 [Rickettsiales bacterium]